MLSLKDELSEAAAVLLRFPAVAVVAGRVDAAFGVDDKRTVDANETEDCESSQSSSSSSPTFTSGELLSNRKKNQLSKQSDVSPNYGHDNSKLTIIIRSISAAYHGKVFIKLVKKVVYDKRFKFTQITKNNRNLLADGSE